MASSYAEVSDTATYSNLYKALRYKGIIGNRYDDFKSENDYRQIIYISSLESPNVRLRDFPKETRFGISVSKKIGNAVIRNRIKRRIKGILKDLNVKSNIEFILIAKKEINDMNYQELKYDLENSISKI